MTENVFLIYQFNSGMLMSHTVTGSKAASSRAPLIVAQSQLALWSIVASVTPWPIAKSLRPREDGLRPTALPITNLSPRQRGLRVVPLTDPGEKTFWQATVRMNGGVPGASASRICFTRKHPKDSENSNYILLQTDKDSLLLVLLLFLKASRCIRPKG